MCALLWSGLSQKFPDLQSPAHHPSGRKADKWNHETWLPKGSGFMSERKHPAGLPRA